MKNRKLFFLINGPIWLTILAYIFLGGIYQSYFKTGWAQDGALTMNLALSIGKFICWLASFYVFYLFLIPNYLFKNKKFKFWILSLLFVVVIGPPIIDLFDTMIGSIVNFETGIINFLLIDSSKVALRLIIWGWFFHAIIISVCGLLAYIFRLAFASFQNEQIKKELELKHHKNQIKMMKAKLNPHFLFNTLNNIDALIQTKPDVASNALSRLSDILRYVVYETGDELISVKTEIENLEKYINLEKMRLVNPGAVSFINTVKKDFEIPPMLFFPFVENAFKHSNLNASGQMLKIVIQENKNAIRFECHNTINENNRETDFKGVGLDLAKKRLDLLYPDRHNLSIEKKNNEFHVILQIDLNL